MSKSGQLHQSKINICEQCRVEFAPVVTRPKMRFCRWSCYLASKKIVYVSKLCPQCGLMFEVSVAVADRYTVCSRACRLANTTYGKCKRCGAPTKPAPGKPRPYCSEECYRPPVYSVCNTCKQRFRHVPAQDRLYCSFKCFRSRGKQESRLERRVRIAIDQFTHDYKQEMRIGKYTVDFAFPNIRTVLEVDGAYWHDEERDKKRDAVLLRYGWKTVRITDLQVKAIADLSAYLSKLLQSS